MADVAQKNLITFDLTNNPELASMFAGKEPGDTCEVTVKMQVKEIDENTVVGMVKKITKDYGDEEHEPVEPTMETPVAISVMPMPEVEGVEPTKSYA